MKRIMYLYKTKRQTTLLILIIIAWFLPETISATPGRGSILISVKSQGKSSIDSIQIDLWEHYTAGANYRLGVSKSAALRNGKTPELTFPLSKLEGIFLIKTFSANGEDYSVYLPVEQGDNVEITIDSTQYRFSGKGARKMQIAYELDELYKKLRTTDYALKDGSYEARAYEFLNKPLDSLLNVRLKHLEKYKGELNPKAYQWLEANTIANDYFRRFNKFTDFKDFGIAVDSTKKKIFEELYSAHLKPLYPKNIPDSILIKTPWFSYFLLMKRSCAFSLDPNFPKQYPDIIEYVKGLPVAIRESYMASYLFLKGVNKLDDSLVDKAMTFIKDPDYVKYLSELRSHVQLGGAAYNFSLDNTKGEIVRLSDFKGKVVFMDFWFTGCKWCKVYYAETLKEVEAHFRGSKDIVFLSISIDTDKKNWMNSINEGLYNGQESINLFTQGKGSNHPLIRYYGIHGYPTQIIIDRGMTNLNVHNGIRVKSATELIQYLEKLIKNPVN